MWRADGGPGRAEVTEPGRFDNVRTDRLLMRRWLDSDREPFAVLNAEPARHRLPARHRHGQEEGPAPVTVMRMLREHDEKAAAADVNSSWDSTVSNS